MGVRFLLAALIAGLCTGGSVRAQVSQTGTADTRVPERVRTTNSRIRRALREGQDKASTFRSLLQQLARSDVVLYIEPGECTCAAARSCVTFVTTAGSIRYLRVIVTLKSGILDPQGKAIEAALRTLGVTGITSVRQGKVFDLELEGGNREQAQAALEQAAEKQNRDAELLQLIRVLGEFFVAGPEYGLVAVAVAMLPHGLNRVGYPRNQLIGLRIRCELGSDVTRPAIGFETARSADLHLIGERTVGIDDLLNRAIVGNKWLRDTALEVLFAKPARIEARCPTESVDGLAWISDGPKVFAGCLQGRE